MAPAASLAAGVGTPALNIGIFAAFVLVTLFVVQRASCGTRSASDYYAAGRSFTGAQNGVALSGDFLSAASFLGIAGAISIYGYDGFLYSTGAFVAWLVALLLVAEPLRNTGRFTMGDVLSFRMRQRPMRTAAAVSTLVVSVFYLLAQMAGAGGLVALLLNVTGAGSQALVIAVVGLLMIFYVLVGGMRGTTWVQIIKAVLLLISGAAMFAWVMGRFGYDFSAMLGVAAQHSPFGDKVLNPGLLYGKTNTSALDFISQALAFVLGTAALPHILMRFYTVPDAKQARRSVSWAIYLIGIFFLISMVLGYASGALVGPKAIIAAPGKSNAAVPLLAYRLGGEVLLGLISAVAFASILAVVAGLTITASASFAHDVYANIIKCGKVEPRREVRVARISAVVIGLVAILGGILANGQTLLLLVALAFAVAASANLPTILFSLFWKRFTTTGALCSVYGGLAISVLLIVFSPAVSGGKESMITGLDFHLFPLSNPGLVSIPASFVLGFVGSLLSKEKASALKFAEMEVRSLTGAGAERVVPTTARPKPAGVALPAQRPAPAAAATAGTATAVTAPLAAVPVTNVSPLLSDNGLPGAGANGRSPQHRPSPQPRRRDTRP